MPPRPLVLVVLLAASLAAADHAPPLGVVESVADGQVALRFDPSVRLAPGSVVAIYGPGTVEKHPLTKQVIVERPAEVAKAQVLGYADGLHRARLAWLAGAAQKPAAIAAGMDAVPIPGAAPNAPPSVAAVEPVAAAAQDAVAVRLPLSDPDGDDIEVAWSIDGPAGRCGRLSARTTRAGEVLWLAPGAAIEATLRGVARDAYGQETAIAVPLRAGPLGDDWRKRELRPFQRLASEPRAVARLARDPRGDWFALDAKGGLTRIAPGWNAERDLDFGKDSAPDRAAALVPAGDLLWILDEGGHQAIGYGADLVAKRRIGGLEAPTDLARDGDGALYVADQGAGGVLVFEPDGRARCRLGHGGKGRDDFEGLVRVDVARDGTVLALDARNRRVQRWDRGLHRLSAWEVQTDDKNPPVDVRAHPRGTLVLLASGKILVVDAAGTAGTAWPSLSQARLADDTGPAAGLCVDLDGEVYATYPQGMLIARYDAEGRPTGVRGAALPHGSRYAADGRGGWYALDADGQSIAAFDAEGFRVARFGGSAKHGGVLVAATAIAATPDGSAVAALDGKKKFVARFATASPDDKPLLFGQPGRNNGQFEEPIAIACDEAGRCYVLDQDLHRVAVFAADGGFLFNAGHYEKGKRPDELVTPTLLAVAPAGDALYVYDADTYEVKKFALDQDGRSARHVGNAGGKGDGPGQLRKPIGIGCDRLGLLYAADPSRGDLQVLDFRGSNAVQVFARKLGDLGAKSPDAFTCAPDGQAYLVDATRIVGVRW